MRILLASLAALSMLPSAALAQAGGYVVTLQSAPPQRVMVKDLQWTCAGTACTATRTGTSADLNVCRAVVRKLGPVRGFAIAERSFDAAEVARCNGE